MAGKLTVVGLGTGDPGSVSLAVREALLQVDRVFVVGDPQSVLAEWRAGRTKIESLVIAASDTGAWWQPAVEAAGQEAVALAVPGAPADLGPDLAGIEKAAADADVDFEDLAGVSAAQFVRRRWLSDWLGELTIVNTATLLEFHYPPIMPSRMALLLWARPGDLSKMQSLLARQYPIEHALYWLRPGSLEQIETVKLEQLERMRDGAGHILIPPLRPNSAFESLQQVVAHLRSPTGCPWDREQTAESLRQHLLEETYEVLAAIDAGETAPLHEELGDLMLQLVMQVQIAQEADQFSMPDVIAAINDKLIRRHPHVFADVDVADVDEVLHNWEAMKAAERVQSGASVSALDGVPAQLPALARAHELQARAARLGFDWREISGVLEKVAEEIAELQQAQSPEERAAEYGDLLFALVNFGRWLQVEPESALRQTNQRFAKRFASVEAAAASQGKDLQSMSLEDLESLWVIAKQDQA